MECIAFLINLGCKLAITVGELVATFRFDLLHAIPLFHSDQHFAWTGALGLAKDAGLSHLVHQSAGAAVADRHLALQHADAAAVGFDHDFNGAIKEWVALAAGVGIAGFAARLARAAWPLDGHQRALEVWRGHGAEMLGDSRRLIGVDECALGAGEFACAVGAHQHVALAKEQLAALAIKDDAAVGDAAHLEADLARHVRFDETRDHFGAWVLSGEHEMHSYRARLLRNADD